MTFTALHSSVNFSVSLSLSLFNGQICLMWEAGDLCALSICIFFSAALSPLTCPWCWSGKCPLVSANHLWSLSEISDQFFPITLCRFNPSISFSLFSLHWKLNCLLFTWGYRWSAHTPFSCFMLFLLLKGLTGFNLVLIFPPFFQYLHSFQYLLPSCTPGLLANPFNRCGSLCGTNRPEAEGCLRPFSLITSHLCVHKQTNTAINLRAQCRQRGGGESEVWIQTEGEFCVIYSCPGRRSGHLPCSVIATSLEDHWSGGLRTCIGFCN